MSMPSLPIYFEPSQLRLLERLKNGNIILVRNYEYDDALVLGQHRLVATGPDQQISNGVCMGVQITGEGKQYLADYPHDWKQCGFDITDFGQSWPNVVADLSLVFLERTKYSFVWRSKECKLFFVTQNNPETGEYAGAGCRDLQKGFASFIGIEGDPLAVLHAATVVKDHAVFFKEYNPHRRSFI